MGEIEFINYYFCESCNEGWEDVWTCACNDRCPSCNKEIEPEKSEPLKPYLK